MPSGSLFRTFPAKISGEESSFTESAVGTFFLFFSLCRSFLFAISVFE
ncbi:hypothetical protein M134_1083 [Bacteroides fragilis str. S24L34]|nr:hypothetical protein M134_1083 [Bacteroides fragilis str. S24L34]OCR42267.1 hypothetical protein AC141_10380 [Bacteroides fragilis]